MAKKKEEKEKVQQPEPQGESVPQEPVTSLPDTEDNLGIPDPNPFADPETATLPDTAASAMSEADKEVGGEKPASPAVSGKSPHDWVNAKLVGLKQTVLSGLHVVRGETHKVRRAHAEALNASHPGAVEITEIAGQG